MCLDVCLDVCVCVECVVYVIFKVSITIVDFFFLYNFVAQKFSA